MRNAIRFPALFGADYQEYFELTETIFFSVSEGSCAAPDSFQDENEVFSHDFLPTNRIIQGSSPAG